MSSGAFTEQISVTNPEKFMFFNSFKVSMLWVVGAAIITSSAALTQVVKSDAIFIPTCLASS